MAKRSSLRLKNANKWLGIDFFWNHTLCMGRTYLLHHFPKQHFGVIMDVYIDMALEANQHQEKVDQTAQELGQSAEGVWVWRL